MLPPLDGGFSEVRIAEAAPNPLEAAKLKNELDFVAV
jgi:hypothetical protein